MEFQYPLFCSIKSILLQHLYKFDGDQSHCCVPWDQVVLTCVEHILASMDSDLWVSGFCDDQDAVEMVVPVEWLCAQAATSLNSATHAATSTLPTSHGRR